MIESRLLTPLTSMSRSASSRGSLMSTAINGVLGSERRGSGWIVGYTEAIANLWEAVIGEMEIYAPTLA